MDIKTNDLIKEVATLIDDQSKKENYNLLEAAGICHREVYICRILYSLLDKSGKHGQKDTFLRLFFENVLCLKDTSLENASVEI